MRNTPREIVGRTTQHLLLYTGALIVLLPFVYMLCVSVREPGPGALGMFLPAGNGALGVDWSRVGLGNYIRLFVELDVIQPLLNSIFFSAASASLATVTAAMAGYTLAKHRFVGRRAVFATVLAALVIPGPLLLAPLYTMLFRLGLLDTYAGLILPAAAPAFGVFLFRQASISSVPTELLEAARIDGCGEYRAFFSIALPLLRPMTSAFVLISFLGAWNNFLLPQVILTNEDKFPLAVFVAQLRGLYGTDYGLIMASTFVSIAPVMVLFLFLQREFISGLTAGAVKG
ncbi:MAG: carbohydrate ABC transporter permease [Planctomycetota bacterium]